MKDSFASRMRKAMEIRDMKQADLVKRTGLSKSAISQYYSGKWKVFILLHLIIFYHLFKHL